MWISRLPDERGKTELEWLQARHSFSFGHYVDDKFDSFHHLRVLNHDEIAPARGFAPHPHDNMEIITYILSGSLRHEDSEGHKGVINAGSLQFMRAGTGIIHSEFNNSSAEHTELYQIWVTPKQQGLKPAYFDLDLGGKNQKRTIVASPTGEGGSFPIAQDIVIELLKVNQGDTETLTFSPDHAYWLQIVKGAVSLRGTDYLEGSGVAIDGEEWAGDMAGIIEAEALLFSMPKTTT